MYEEACIAPLGQVSPWWPTSAHFEQTFFFAVLVHSRAMCPGSPHLKHLQSDRRMTRAAFQRKGLSCGHALEGRTWVSSSTHSLIAFHALSAHLCEAQLAREQHVDRPEPDALTPRHFQRASSHRVAHHGRRERERGQGAPRDRQRSARGLVDLVIVVPLRAQQPFHLLHRRAVLLHVLHDPDAF